MLFNNSKIITLLLAIAINNRELFKSQKDQDTTFC